MKIAALAGPDLKNAPLELARLRIEVFPAYPYLYDGAPGSEQGYLAALAQSRDSIIVSAEADGQIVGCGTGSALEGHHEEFAAPGVCLLRRIGCPSPLQRTGLRDRFFDLREAHAKAHGYKYSAFCAVVRPGGRRLRPATYSPLDTFWKKRGYRKAEGMTAMFRWKDIDQPHETAHPMQFWIRELA